MSTRRLRISLFNLSGNLLAQKEGEFPASAIASLVLHIAKTEWSRLVDPSSAEVEGRTQLSVEGVDLVYLRDRAGEVGGYAEVEDLEHCVLCSDVADIRQEMGR